MKHIRDLGLEKAEIWPTENSAKACRLVNEKILSYTQLFLFEPYEASSSYVFCLCFGCWDLTEFEARVILFSISKTTTSHADLSSHKELISCALIWDLFSILFIIWWFSLLMRRLPSWVDCFAFCFHFFHELVLSFNSSDSLLRCLVIHVRRFLVPLSKFVRSHTHMDYYWVGNDGRSMY